MIQNNSSFSCTRWSNEEYGNVICQAGFQKITLVAGLVCLNDQFTGLKIVKFGVIQRLKSGPG